MSYFFQKSKNNEDWLYSQIRDCSERADTRKQIEFFWKKYKEYAPESEEHFLSVAQGNGNFKQRWWEMILSVGKCGIFFKEIRRRRLSEDYFSY